MHRRRATFHDVGCVLEFEDSSDQIRADVLLRLFNAVLEKVHHPDRIQAIDVESPLAVLVVRLSVAEMDDFFEGWPVEPVFPED